MTCIRKYVTIISIIIATVSLSGCSKLDNPTHVTQSNGAYSTSTSSNEDSAFTEEEIEQGKNSFYSLGEIDSLGRPTIQLASFTRADIEASKRTDISSIYPLGYHQLKDDSIPGKFLYNRSHLIARSLAGADIASNLITGTQQLNQKDMKRTEDYVREYVYSHPDVHVLYKVMPLYHGSDLVPYAIKMMAKTIENNDININVEYNNIQPGFVIDYATGYADKIT